MHLIHILNFRVKVFVEGQEALNAEVNLAGFTLPLRLSKDTPRFGTCHDKVPIAVWISRLRCLPL